MVINYVGISSGVQGGRVPAALGAGVRADRWMVLRQREQQLKRPEDKTAGGWEK